MSDPVAVIFVQKTGHVLGCLTRKAGPESKFPPPASGSPAFLVRHLNPAATTGPPTDLIFEVDQESLNIAVVETQKPVLSRPRTLAVKDPANPTELTDLNTGRVVAAATEFHQDRLDITITFPGPLPNQPTPVWFQIEQSSLPGPLVMDDEIPAGSATASFSFAERLRPATDYRILVLAGECPPFVKKKNLP